MLALLFLFLFLPRSEGGCTGHLEVETCAAAVADAADMEQFGWKAENMCNKICYTKKQSEHHHHHKHDDSEWHAGGHDYWEVMDAEKQCADDHIDHLLSGEDHSDHGHSQIGCKCEPMDTPKGNKMSPCKTDSEGKGICRPFNYDAPGGGKTIEKVAPQKCGALPKKVNHKPGTKTKSLIQGVANRFDAGGLKMSDFLDQMAEENPAIHPAVDRVMKDRGLIDNDHDVNEEPSGNEESSGGPEHGVTKLGNDNDHDPRDLGRVSVASLQNDLRKLMKSLQ